MELLPNEIIDLIVSRLPMRDFYALGATNRAVHGLLAQIYGNLYQPDMTAKIRLCALIKDIKEYLKYDVSYNAYTYVNDTYTKISAHDIYNYTCTNLYVYGTSYIQYNNMKGNKIIFGYTLNYISDGNLYLCLSTPIRNKLFVDAAETYPRRVLFVIEERLSKTTYKYNSSSSKLRKYRPIG
jgi:hypothetical protein